MSIKTHQLLSVFVWICGGFVIPAALTAQASATTTLDFSTGSEFENYLRVLQVAGLEQVQPWSIRGLGPRITRQLASADTAGPWALRKNFNDGRLFTGRNNLATTIN